MRKLWHRLFGHGWKVGVVAYGATSLSSVCRCGHVAHGKPASTSTAYGLVSVNGILYTATLDSSKNILLRQSKDGGFTWTTTQTPTYRSGAQDNG